MGIVFSCLGSSVLLVGEMVSAALLAVGEVGSLLVRGIFGALTAACDVLAACMCCCRVPFSDRPDRDGYTYSTIRTPAVMSKYNTAAITAAAATTEEGEQQPAATDVRMARVMDTDKFGKHVFMAPMQLIVKPQITFTPTAIKKPRAEGEANGDAEEKKDEATANGGKFFSGLTAAFKRADKPEEASGEPKEAKTDVKGALANLKKINLNKFTKKAETEAKPAEDKPAEAEGAAATTAAVEEAPAKKRGGVIAALFGKAPAADEEAGKKEEEAPKKDE